jgi:predicted hydrolase (HD superfamily)
MHTDYIPTTSLDKSLIAAVTGAGLIITVLRSTSSKKISEFDLGLVVVRFHDSNFARRYNKNKIYLCEDLGMQLEFFLDLCLNSIKEILD